MSSIAVTSRSFSKHPILRQKLLEKYEHVAFNDSGKTLTGNDLIQFLQGHERAIVGLEKLDETVLGLLPDLKVISRFGVGLDTLDLNAIKKKNIKLASTIGANKRAVAELVIAFAIMMLRDVPRVSRQLKEKIWQPYQGRQLSDCSFGIVGLGAIGKDLAKLLTSFGSTVYYYDGIPQEEFTVEMGIKLLPLENLLHEVDIISLHLPLTDLTKNFINAERLALLKPRAILINTARGELICEEDLKVFLQKNPENKVCCDVFHNEPMVDADLLKLDNFFGTPHIGGSTEEAVLAMGHAAILGLETARFI